MLLDDKRVGNGVRREATEDKGVAVNEDVDGPKKIGSERGRRVGPDEVTVGKEAEEIVTLCERLDRIIAFQGRHYMPIMVTVCFTAIHSEEWHSIRH